MTTQPEPTPAPPTEPRALSEAIVLSRADVTEALESINYHYIVMAKAAGTWRRKRPPQNNLADGCDHRCTELEALYRRLNTATERPADGVVISRSQIPALSDALCRGIEGLVESIRLSSELEDRDGLIGDLEAILNLRDDLQRQINAALSAASGEPT